MKNIIKAIAFIIIFLMMMIFLNKLLNPAGTMIGGWKERRPVQELYVQKKDTIDVLYVGASSVYCGISPLEVYNINGVTGYTYSSSEQAVWTSYYFIKEALKTQTPKVIFLETQEFFMTKKTEKSINNRMDMEELKLSANKINMMNDSIYNLSLYDKLTLICPALYYHSRWNQLNEEDKYKFKDSEKLYKGYILNKTINPATDIEQKRINAKIDEEITQIPDEISEYLSKIKTLCDENNCKLVFISMPYQLSYNQKEEDAIDEYAKLNSIPFINLNKEDSLAIDWSTDSLDADGNHLNVYGAEKVGKYLANYINNNFSLEDHRTDSKYKGWNKILKKYQNEKDEK